MVYNKKAIFTICIKRKDKRKLKRRILGFVICLAVFLMVGSAVIYAATGSFVIHKVDQHGDPVKGAEFEIYGKPVLTTDNTTRITVTKQWLDGENAYELRPEVAAFAGSLHLLADGQEVQGAEPEIEGIDGQYWQITYTGLPKTNSNGKEIAYTVSEDAIEHYKTEGSPAADSGTITNTLVQDVTFYKIWNVGEYTRRTGASFEPIENMKWILNEDGLSRYAGILELFRTTDTQEDWKNLMQPDFENIEAFTADASPVIEVCSGFPIYTPNRYARDCSDAFAVCSITYKDLPRYDSDNEEVLYIVSEEQGVERGLFIWTVDSREKYFNMSACGKPFDPNNLTGYVFEPVPGCPVTIENGVIMNSDISIPAGPIYE